MIDASPFSRDGPLEEEHTVSDIATGPRRTASTLMARQRSVKVARLLLVILRSFMASLLLPPDAEGGRRDAGDTLADERLLSIPRPRDESPSLVARL